jgi:hypothetical protein
MGEALGPVGEIGGRLSGDEPGRVFRHTEASGETADAQFIEQAQAWFSSIWDNISYEFPA